MDGIPPVPGKVVKGSSNQCVGVGGGLWLKLEVDEPALHCADLASTITRSPPGPDSSGEGEDEDEDADEDETEVEDVDEVGEDVDQCNERSLDESSKCLGTMPDLERSALVSRFDPRFKPAIRSRRRTSRMT